jgi:acetylglutamate kinase
MQARLDIVKIGGHLLDDPAATDRFMDAFRALEAPKILVHGGGKKASEISQKLGLQPKLVDGRRITDAPTLEVVTMVYAGLINKNLVAGLQQRGCNAIGLTGADGKLIRAHRRNSNTTDYGWVGDVRPEYVNTALLYFLLKQNTVPVIAPLTFGEGTLLNTNADTLASVLSISLCKHFRVRLFYCFEKKGVLRDPEDENSVIKQLNETTYDQLLREGVISNGMLPKLKAAFEAVHQGVHEVFITHAHALPVNTGMQNSGTRIMA